MKKFVFVLTALMLVVVQVAFIRSETITENLFDNFTTSSPNFRNGATKEAKFTINQPYKITGIATVHWNEGKGTPEYGKISLRSSDGKVYGPWQTKAYPGKTTAEKVFWISEPNEVIKAGSYTIIDSDPATWSWSDESEGVGLAMVEGEKSSQSQAVDGKKTIILQIGNPKMIVNGASVYIDPGIGTCPAIIGGRTLLPIRSVVETLGGRVGWDAKTQTVSLSLANVDIQLVIGKTQATVSKTPKTLDQAPVIVKGRTLIPLRFVSENLGCQLDWKDSTKTITIRFLGSLISIIDGGQVANTDGATLIFGKNSVSGNISASIEKVAESAGDKSAQYKVEILSGSSGWFRVGIPLSAKFDKEKDNVQALKLNEDTGKWHRFNQMANFDEKTGIFTFTDFLDDRPKPTQDIIPMSVTRALPGNRGTYTVQIINNWTDSGVTVRLPESNFRICYYRAGQGCFVCLGDRVPSDSAWDDVGSGVYPATNVDHYIQDLDRALNDAYSHLIDLNQNDMFQPLQVPFTVWVQDCGANIQGVTPLGGGYFNRLFISCNQIENYQQLKLVACHELIHVFQGQYYSGVRAQNDIWFVEAVAMGLSTTVMATNQTESYNYYRGNNTQIGYENYLRNNLYANDANSFYACGLFVEWLMEEYGQEILLQIYESDAVTDFYKIDAVFREDNSSFAQEFFYYCRYIQTHPQQGHRLNNEIKASIRRYQNSSQRIFGVNTLFYTFTDTLRSYSARMTGYSVNQSIAYPGLLVAESGGSNKSIRTNSYNFTSTTDSAYEAKDALEGTDYLIPYSKTMTVPYFGYTTAPGVRSKNLEQLFVNSLPYSDATVKMNYYLLLEPRPTTLEKGMIRWSYAQQANIPLDYIKGYNIVVNGVRLSGKTPLKPVNGEMTFKHESILKTQADVVRIQVEDKFGNVWPNDINVVNETKVTFDNYTENERQEKDANGNTFKVIDVAFDIIITDLPTGVKPEIIVNLGDQTPQTKYTSFPIHITHTYPCSTNPFDDGYTLTVEVNNFSTGKKIATGRLSVGCKIKLP